jgi:hypothetical protein
MRKTILAAAFTLVATAAHADDLVYACSMGGRDTMSLNLTLHQFHFVDHVGVLNEGDIQFNFRTNAGYLIQMDLGDPDRLHFGKPRVVKGWGSVGGPGGSQGRLEKVTCVRTR